MDSLRYCTLTGLDEHVDVDGIAKLARHFDRVEWGVLFSRSRMQEEAGKGRYPREAWIREFADFAQANKLRTALHLRGSDALAFLRGDEAVREAAGRFQRVQLNLRAEGRDAAPDLPQQKVARAIHNHIIEGLGTHSVILQHNMANAELCCALKGTLGFEMLVDSSAGRGVSPKSWSLDQLEVFGQRVGFAGGLGPDNIGEQMPLIAQAAQGKSFWVDMEGMLRDASDRFDLSACQSVLQQVSEWHHASICRAGAQAAERDRPATDLEQLDGLYLNWWAGLASGRSMVIPPANASRAMCLDRFSGRYESFDPLESANDKDALIEEFFVGCVREKGRWVGVSDGGERVASDERKHALLRAVVLDAFGPTLPANVADAPRLHKLWLGEGAAQDILGLRGKASGARP